MNMRLTPLLAAVLVISAPAFAESIRKNLAQAADRLEEAVEDNNRGAPMCRTRSEQLLRQAIDRIDDLGPADDPARFDQVVQQVQGVLTAVRAASCPNDYVRDIERSLSDLQEAARDMRRRRPGGPPPPPMGPGSVVFNRAEVQQGGPGATVSIPTITLNGMQGRSVYYAWHWAPEGGAWSAWESLPAIVVNRPQFVWNNPYRPVIDWKSLQNVDNGSRRFVVHAGIFDMDGRELQGIDVSFTATYSGAPQPPPPLRPMPMRPMPPQQPPPPPPPGNPGVLPPPPPMGRPQARDCGLGLDDPGCSMVRNGGMAMDRPTFEGFMTTLKATISESAKGQMVRDTCRAKFVTARQLGVLMDLFIGENNRLDAAKNCASRVVDPNNALAFGAKFISSSRQREYNALMTSQR